MYIFQVMHRENILSINQVSLQLGVLNVQNLIVKLFDILIAHSVLIKQQIVTNDNLQLFSPYVTTSVIHLSFIRIYVFWLLAETMSVLSVDFRNNVLFFFVEFNVIHKSYFTLLHFTSL